VVSATAEPALADAVAGRALARDLCSQCHDIGEPAEPGNVRSGPAFHALAQTRSKAELQDFLRAPHKRMRKVALSPQEIRDLTSYIQLMKRSD
jgi:mono/diheme cytochrome c family protein